MMLYRYQQHQEELRRNREYEISLVNALKNSYEGIEEIEITEPNYTYPPEDWSCDLEIKFKDGKKIAYGISHSLDKKQNYDGAMWGETNSEVDTKWDILYARKGQTNYKVSVIYSDKEKGEQ